MQLPTWAFTVAAVLCPAAAAWTAGSPGPSALKPIARWTTVPYQRVEAGQVLKCGVVAFSKSGIAEVRFTINGTGYMGPASISVFKMTLNDQTGMYEYWLPVRADDFLVGSVITVEASVYGGDGGIRDKATDGGGLGLDPLPLVINSTGNLPRVQAWVSHGASKNSDGLVNDVTAPFATVGDAIEAIRQFRREHGLGDNADGGVVRLVGSDTPYVCSRGAAKGRVPCENEWLTITTADGENQGNAVLTAPASLLPVEKVCLRGVTLLHNASFGLDDPKWCSLWVDRCTLIGDGRGVNRGHPLLKCNEYKRTYYTDSAISQLAQATTGAAMCRGLSISQISDDAFQNVPLVVNSRVDDIQPIGPDGQIDFRIHADGWQHFGGNEVNRRDDNLIVYNLVATNLGYQNLFIAGDLGRQPSFAQGMAFVNVYMDCKQVPELQNRHGGWSRWVDHLLWWNCSLVTQGICIGYADYDYDGQSHPGLECRIRNFSCVGCDFAFLRLEGSDAGIDWSGWHSNHFVALDEGVFVARGENYTTGDHMLDGSGVPSAGSPLLQRFTPLVPTDAGHNVRGPWSDVGAFQRIPPAPQGMAAPADSTGGNVSGPTHASGGDGLPPAVQQDEASGTEPSPAHPAMDGTVGAPVACGQASPQVLLTALLCLRLLNLTRPRPE